MVEPCELHVSYSASVNLMPNIETPDEVNETATAQMPPEVFTYLNSSRYCESDLLARFAFEEFGQLYRGYSRVQAICNWVYEYLDYTPGSTNATTTASDVLLQRTGVCRDYAHLAITLCRGLGIPARYVAGYAVNLMPPDFHGFMEAYLDGKWYLFDPTRLSLVSGLVRIGMGRDAADVSFASLTGDARLTSKNVWANEVSGQSQYGSGDIGTSYFNCLIDDRVDHEKYKLDALGNELPSSNHRRQLLFCTDRLGAAFGSLLHLRFVLLQVAFLRSTLSRSTLFRSF